MEPITTTTVLAWLGTTAIGGVIEGKSDGWFHKTTKPLLDNLRRHRPEANNELQRAVYCSYLQATLQVCALRAQNIGINIDEWIRREPLPGRMKKLATKLRHEPSLGIFSQAEAQWLFAAITDSREKLSLLDKDRIDPPSKENDERFKLLLDQFELLIQPRGDVAANRIAEIRSHLCEGVIADLGETYGKDHGPVPEAVAALVRDQWFELLCACFQHAIKNDQAIANIFQSELLAGIFVEMQDGKSEQISFAQIEEQFIKIGGEFSRQFEATRRLIESQGVKIEGIESDFLVPLLALAHDEAARLAMIEEFINTIAETQRQHLALSQDTNLEIKSLRAEISGRIIRDGGPKNLINLPNLNIIIDDRLDECAAVIDALRDEKGTSVIVIVAPGGFGKTALLTKVIQQVTDGETINVDYVQAILYVECLGGRATLDAIFTDAGIIAGRQDQFQQLSARVDAAKGEMPNEFFSELSRAGDVWIAMDNFEDMLDSRDEIKDERMRLFIERCLALDHRVKVIITSRNRPLIGRNRPMVLENVSKALNEGLPQGDAVAYLRREGAQCGLGEGEASEETLRRFARLVHGIPMALASVVGYLSDEVYPATTLAKLMEDEERFADFRRKDFESGLRRLISDQLAQQSEARMLILKALSFFSQPVPQPALEPLLERADLERALNRLTVNRLVAVETDWHDVNYYSIHPIISQVVSEQGEAIGPSSDSYLDEGYAATCLRNGNEFYNKPRYRLAVGLLECSAKVYDHLVNSLGRDELSNSLAAALMNKGVALDSLGRLQEAIDSYDQAIARYRQLVEVEHRDELSNDLASALMNKALVLEKTERRDEALASYDEAVRMCEYCVVEAGMIHRLPSLLKTVRYRLMTLLDLKRQEEAARDVLRFLGYFESFKNDAPQEATQKEFNQFVGVLRSHSDDETLFAALGADAERIRKLIEE